MRINSALYIDGFNLYHAVNDLGEPFLKWCNLWKLGETIIPTHSERLVKVVLCTAFYPGDDNKNWRHRQFNAAQEINGVTVVIGHYMQEPMECRDCGNQWRKPTEKETDINVALHLMNDAWQGVYERAYLLTADSDQAATVRIFRERFPNLSIVSVAPPERNFSVHITKLVNGGRIALKKEHLERCLLPSIVLGNGMSARRPREYAPPSWWVSPDMRPR